MQLSPEARKVIAEINKEYGEGTVIKASEIIQPDRITTGSLAFDVSLGGGWPVNQWHEIVGLESAGKTCVCLQTIAANQATNPEFVAVWIAAEWYDPDYAEMIGVDNDRVIVVNENITERAFGVALKWLKSQACDMIVIDSLPAMTPGDEAEAAMEDVNVALQARLTNKFFRKQGSSGKRAMDNTERPCTCLLINQWRDKIGIQWGDPRTTPGGNGKNYSFFTRTEVRQDEWITVGPKSQKHRVGQTIKCRVFKNKSAPPHRVATFDFYFEDADVHPAGSIDTFKEIVGLGVVHGVITQPSDHSEKSSWLEYHGVRANGADNMCDALAGDLDVAEVLRKEVLAVATAKKHNLPEEIDPEEGIHAEPVITDPPKKRTVKRTAAKKTAAKKTTRGRR
jgi:recombination protein RecA